MKKLNNRFLKKKIDVSLSNTPKSEIATVRSMIKNANQAKFDSNTNRWTFSERRVIKPSMKIALPAPTLKLSGTGFFGAASYSWTKIDGASGYILETSLQKDFNDASVIYEGDDTKFSGRGFPASLRVVKPASSARTVKTTSRVFRGALLFGVRYYRVKAKGSRLYSDSPWSDTVVFKPNK